MVTLIAPRKIVATATASATLVRGAHTPVNAASGALTMTLPANAPAGVEVSVEKVDASTNAVTISGTLRGVASSINLTSQYEARTLLSDGAGSWTPISDHRTTASMNLINPNDVGFDLILAAGQSNMAGRGMAFDATRYDPIDPRIFQWAGSGTYINQISLAVEPLAHHEFPPGMGPALVFARWYAHQAPTNRRILVVPVAHGGTGFTTSSLASPPAGYTGNLGGNWRTDAADGGLNLYAFAVAQAKAALAAAGPNSRFTALLWHQGESDGSLTQAQYAAQLDLLIAGFRTNIPTAANAPFILGQMVPDNVNNHGSAIEKAHIDTPRRVTGTAFAYAPTGRYNADNPPIHFDAPGQRLLGRSYFDALPVARANVLSAAPLAPSGVALTQAGTTLSATWSRPQSRFTDWTVQYAVAGSGTWTTLTRTPNLDTAATITGLTKGTSYDVRVLSVNEVGTSAPSPVATATMLRDPNAPTGLATTGTTTASAQSLTWVAPATDATHSAASSYVLEFKRTSDSSWTLFGTVTGLAATVTGLTSSTAYDFRVSASNAGGTSAPSSTVSGTTAAATTPVGDAGVAAARAYGLRRVVTGYAGSAVKVRRSSDNTTADIGFSGVGIDQTALLTFVGAGGSGYIDTFYDQSGNSRHLTQTTTAKQARIVNAGVVDKMNGVPAAVFDGVDDIYQDASPSLYGAGAASVAIVAQASTAALAVLCGEGGTGAGPRYLPAYLAASQQNFLIRDDASASLANPALASNVVLNTPFQVSSVDTGTSVYVAKDGLAGTAAGYSRAGHTLTLNSFSVGALAGGTTFQYFLAGSIGELVAWTSALSVPQRQAAEANQKAYYATP